MSKAQRATFNGIDLERFRGLVDSVAVNPVKGLTRWEVVTNWCGGTGSVTQVTGGTIGGERLVKNFTIHIDEPIELLGRNEHANPQEYLLAALNACMIVGYTVGCALEGIQLEELRIETEGEIDLRGFLGISPDVKPGYDQIHYTVHIKGDASPEQLEKIHRTVMATSPNYFNLRNSVSLHSRLVVH